MHFLTKIGMSLLLLASLCIASEASFASQYNYLTSYQEARAKALQTHKPLMILFVTTSCPWCQKLENQTLNKDEVNDYVQFHFVPVLLNKDIDTFPEVYDPFVSPTIFFVDAAKETKYAEILGYKPSSEFFELLQKAHNTYKKAHP
ncbi:MAG: thioredoxin family protein [Sulfurospirillaceae bacterium]|nr:thioredoxin family protein [Sulfurospirillaceae bacterium]